MSILILLPVEGSRLQYVLTCPSVEDRWLYLLRWLTEKNIGFATQDEYQNPESLKPQSMYCVIGKGELQDSYLLFQVLQLQDWEGEKPVPQYTTIVGNLAWLLQQTDVPVNKSMTFDVVNKAKLFDVVNKAKLFDVEDLSDKKEILLV